GGSGTSPNLSKSKFGAEKTDNTPHEFLIGGNRVECYFSPSDNTNQKIIDAIKTANNDLSVQTMLITRSDLAWAIKDIYDKGVEVQVITNYDKDNSETVNDILSSTLPSGKFIFDGIANGILHHKLAIIDANMATSDPQVITGSHNWSNSANQRNDENTLIIHNADIANQFFQQFAYRFAENGGDLHVSAEIIEFDDLKVYPNPASNSIYINSSEAIKRIQIYSSAGILCIDEFPLESNASELNIQNLQTGLYLLKVETTISKVNSYKIIKN
ncbi:MAG: phospholipase D-like domain-containing protein, partial [Draconibacterium sp.]|nr:phospholipase D-like domain-containing protein [Draconibacterium sp.]